MGLIFALVLAVIIGILGWTLSPLMLKGVPQEMLGLVRFSVALVGATLGAVVGLIIAFITSAKRTQADKDRYRI